MCNKSPKRIRQSSGWAQGPVRVKWMDGAGSTQYKWCERQHFDRWLNDWQSAKSCLLMACVDEWMSLLKIDKQSTKMLKILRPINAVCRSLPLSLSRFQKANKINCFVLWCVIDFSKRLTCREMSNDNWFLLFWKFSSKINHTHVMSPSIREIVQKWWTF